MKSSKRASAKQSKNTRSKNKKTDTPSLAHSDEEKNSIMDIEHDELNESFQLLADEILCDKNQIVSDITNIPEFKIELPQYFESYDSFVSKIDPLLQQLEDYIRNDGNVAESIAPQFEGHKAIHLTGAILQSILRFNQTGRKIAFAFDEARINQKEDTLSQQALKPILKQLKNQSKSTQNLDLVYQEFVLTNQEDFDPFIIYDEKSILLEIETIIKEYESLFNSEDSENHVNYFNKKFNRGELSVSDKPKRSLKKKTGPEQTGGDEEILRAKSQLLMSDIRRDVKGSQEQFSQTSPTTTLSKTGGEILFSVSTPIEAPKKLSAEELQLRDALISEYNSPSDSGLQNALKAFLVKKTKRLKLSIHTAILLSIVYNVSVRRQDMNWSDASISSNITIAALIPFPTASTLQILNCKYYIAKALDAIMNVEIENCIPRSAYFPALQEFDYETHEENEKSAKLYRKFIALYQSLQISTETSSKLSLYYEQLGALSKIFKLLAPRSASQDKENMSPCKANTTPSLLQLDSLMNGIKNIPGLTGFAEYQSFAHAHLMAITGGLILQKSSNEDEWVSPKFGIGSDSSAIKSSSIKKDIRTVMQDLSQISEVNSPKEAFMNPLISADSHVKYDQAFNSTDFGELSWSYHDSPKLTEKSNNTCVEESKSKLSDLIFEGNSKCQQNHSMEIEDPIPSIRHKELREEIITQENEIEEKSILPAKTKKKRNSKKSVESHIDEDEKAKDSIETYLKECKDPKEKKIIKQYSKRLNDLVKKTIALRDRK